MKPKRTLALLLALVMCLSLCACGATGGTEPQLSSDTLVGTWKYTKGDLYKINKPTLQFEIYKGGSAKEVYEENSHNNFSWEIDENDTDVVNFQMEGMFGNMTGTKGFTMERNENGILELHSVDGEIILVKQD